MKLRIDKGNKTVRFEGTIKLNDLINELEIRLPGEWREYKLIPVVVKNETTYPTYTIYNPYTVL